MMKKQNGFTLFEAAISLFIVGLLLTSFYKISELLFDVDKNKKENVNIQSIEHALNSFLTVNHFLPCPDTSTPRNGKENRDSSTNACSSDNGGLPYLDLGVNQFDAWNNPYYYKVHEDATDGNSVREICQPESVFGYSGARLTSNFYMCPSTNIYYCGTSSQCDDACPTSPSVTPASVVPTVSTSCVAATGSLDPRPAIGGVSDAPYFHLATPPVGTILGANNLVVENAAGDQLGAGVVAVVISWGENGREVNSDTCSNSSSQELENCDGDRTFVNTITTENRDFVRWISVHQAKMSLIDSGAMR